MIVMKFGGTSVRDAEAIRRVATIVASACERGAAPLVVVSAMAAVTDHLMQAATLAARGARDEAAAIVEHLAARHRVAGQALARDADGAALVDRLDADWQHLTARLDALARARALTPRALDAVAAAGEIASSRLLTAALRAHGLPAIWIDARRLLVTDDEHGAARPDMAATRARVRVDVQPHLVAGRVPVIGGFIGATARGVPTTLGRGGSDYSASIFGALLDATEIQIWTDVDGMLTADPRVIAGTRPVACLSFVEAYQLAYFGAKVLHPRAIAPAAAAHIPLRIVNACGGQGPGTIITAMPPRSPARITALACRRDVTMIAIASSHGSSVAQDRLGRVLRVFARYRTPVDLIVATETRVIALIDDTRHLAAILAALQRFVDATTERHVALLCAVGERLRTDASLAVEIRELLDRIDLHAVSRGSPTHLAIILPQAQLAEAMTRIHLRFCTPDRDDAASVTCVPIDAADARVVRA